MTDVRNVVDGAGIEAARKLLMTRIVDLVSSVECTGPDCTADLQFPHDSFPPIDDAMDVLIRSVVGQLHEDLDQDLGAAAIAELRRRHPLQIVPPSPN